MYLNRKNIIAEKSKTPRIIVSLTVLTLVYWSIGQIVNVYHSKIIGALFEILWLPMIVFLFVLPLAALVLWSKEKFKINSFYLLSLAILIATICFLIYYNG